MFGKIERNISTCNAMSRAHTKHKNLKYNFIKNLIIKKILIPTDGYGLEDHVIKYVARAFPFADFDIISIINM